MLSKPMLTPHSMIFDGDGIGGGGEGGVGSLLRSLISPLEKYVIWLK